MNRDRKGLNRSQRMQLKAFICLLGALLLVILLLAKFVSLLVHRAEPEPEDPSVIPYPHVPVVNVLTNVWILDAGTEELVIFRDGVRESYPYGILTEGAGEGLGAVMYGPDPAVREQVADVVLTDGAVTDIFAKTEKVNGRILSADENGIEVEGLGVYPLDEDYKGYRLYDQMAMCTAGDICFGYDFTDLVLDEGSVCGILLAKEEAMEYIRVLLKSGDYGGNYHEQLILSGDTDFTVIYGPYENRTQETYHAGEEVTIERDSSYFDGDRVWIRPEVLTGKLVLKNVGRSQGIPSYRGTMELLNTEDGIVVINEVLLEEYLYSVVPSEMPSKYPAEALKAQAICARTYAYGHMEHAGYPRYGAHVDDSTSYQVYNNILEQESTSTAVKETYGQLLLTGQGETAGTYYYSTSCGVGTEATIWKTEAAAQIDYLHARALNPEGSDLGSYLQDEDHFAAFIRQRNEDDFESDESWYRWTYEVKKLDAAHMLEVLRKRYDANDRLVLTLADGEYVSREIEELDVIKDIYIEKRGSGGVADELIIETEEHTYKVISEHNIRYVLNDGQSKVRRQDGSQGASLNLLPSGFFVITTEKEKGKVTGYSLVGGGFGHGVGMSQNGAKEMAKYGYDAQDILLFFYDGCHLENIYGAEGESDS
ncbi:MAG: SpoIID/LytB domain-containing protein [Eubacterium sp.]|nr:SpoIID/LytB domain-containing protein [Eubacterium sp.]MCM1217407.1 SpoIID/LytB domain-containing protein [Lachnospiraceae bacterium]MCM1305513.1 SpoIID/LytB domain-containing protein [Butyrivibrio sp.]MCM1342368.1 SpoIID/LytB domain-containing protein [Muribaculaceae bacterium]MCM1238601.1 SpoIID/LytB domain-containing protein [Lachnospiraceae bacterium]